MRPNARCPCGSGKKFKHCHGRALPRTRVITARFERPVEVHGFKLSSDGVASLFDARGQPIPPAEATLQTQRPRQKGPKVLNSIALDPSQLSAAPDEVLLRFDRVYAVDTNTRLIRGARVSVTAVVLAGMSALPGIYKVGPMSEAIEHRNVTCDPELLGWHFIAAGLDASDRDEIRSLRRIGLLVDSHLGEIPAINERRRAIVDDHKLPPRFTLLYASSDGGKESVLNRMISEADSSATSLLDRIEQRAEWDHQSMMLPHQYADYFRIWELED